MRTLLLFCLLIVPAAAENWAHWRGPTGNGTSESATPPTDWSDSRNVRWKAEIPGRGSGSPVVWEDRVFVVSAVGDEGSRRGPRELDFRLMCFDRATGELVWSRSAVRATPHEGTHDTNGFASASPCTDGEAVYAHFGSRGLFCFSMDGELKWSRTDLGRMQTRAGFGEGSSPTLAGDLIIVPFDHEGPSKLFAFNKHDGSTVWETARDEPTCWATPLIVNVDGRDQIVMNGQNYARAYDLKTGEELWRCSGQTQRPVASAVASDGVVYVGSGFRGSFLAAFRPTGRGDIRGTDNVLWSVNRDTPDIASPLLSGNRLYYFKAKTGILTCVNAATGQPFYETQRLPELNTLYASPIAAGGYVYVTDRSGTTVVLRDAEEYEVVSVNKVGETVDATPAAVDKELFIRGEKRLFCISE